MSENDDDTKLNNCESGYKKWVHLHEAAQYDVYPKNDSSIFALNRQKKIHNLSIKEQLLKYGYWTGKEFYPKCYLEHDSNGVNFNGIIASIKIKTMNKIKTALIFLGVGTNKYIHVNINNFKTNFGYFIGIKGCGEYKNNRDVSLNVITCDNYSLF